MPFCSFYSHVLSIYDNQILILVHGGLYLGNLLHKLRTPISLFNNKQLNTVSADKEQEQSLKSHAKCQEISYSLKAS